MKQLRLDGGTSPPNQATRGDDARRVPIDDPGRSLVLVGCGADKADEPQPAKDLYRSSYFSVKRDVAELADTWFILSAEHGLVAPDRVLEPYDTEWSELPEATRTQRVTEIVADLTPVLSLVDRVIFLAGHNYRDPLISTLDEHDGSVTVVSPFDATSGFHDQMQLLAAERDRLEKSG